MTEKEQKQVIVVEVDAIPMSKIGPIQDAYDQVIPAALAATKDTITVEITNTVPKQLYAALHYRIEEYNGNPDRAYDMLMAQRQGKTYLKRFPKGELIKQTQD